MIFIEGRIFNQSLVGFVWSMVLGMQLQFLDDHKLVKTWSLFFCLLLYVYTKEYVVPFSSSSLFFWGKKECCEDICTCKVLYMWYNGDDKKSEFWLQVSNESNREVDFIYRGYVVVSGEIFLFSTEDMFSVVFESSVIKWLIRQETGLMDDQLTY